MVSHVATRIGKHIWNTKKACNTNESSIVVNAIPNKLNPFLERKRSKSYSRELIM